MGRFTWFYYSVLHRLLRHHEGLLMATMAHFWAKSEEHPHWLKAAAAQMGGFVKSAQDMGEEAASLKAQFDEAL